MEYIAFPKLDAGNTLIYHCLRIASSKLALDTAKPQVGNCSNFPNSIYYSRFSERLNGVQRVAEVSITSRLSIVRQHVKYHFKVKLNGILFGSVANGKGQRKCGLNGLGGSVKGFGTWELCRCSFNLVTRKMLGETTIRAIEAFASDALSNQI